MWKSLRLGCILLVCDMCFLLDNSKQTKLPDLTQTNPVQVSILFSQLERNEG